MLYTVTINRISSNPKKGIESIWKKWMGKGNWTESQEGNWKVYFYIVQVKDNIMNPKKGIESNMKQGSKGDPSVWIPRRELKVIWSKGVKAILVYESQEGNWKITPPSEIICPIRIPRRELKVKMLESSSTQLTKESQEGNWKFLFTPKKRFSWYWESQEGNWKFASKTETTK